MLVDVLASRRVLVFVTIHDLTSGQFDSYDAETVEINQTVHRGGSRPGRGVLEPRSDFH